MFLFWFIVFRSLNYNFLLNWRVRFFFRWFYNILFIIVLFFFLNVLLTNDIQMRKILLILPANLFILEFNFLLAIFIRCYWSKRLGLWMLNVFSRFIRRHWWWQTSLSEIWSCYIWRRIHWKVWCYWSW